MSEYWIINPEAHTVAVLLLEEGEFRPAGIYGEGSALSSASIEGFSIKVDEIFPS